jgi:hypothetical protein
MVLSVRSTELESNTLHQHVELLLVPSMHVAKMLIKRANLVDTSISRWIVSRTWLPIDLIKSKRAKM